VLVIKNNYPTGDMLLKQIFNEHWPIIGQKKLNSRPPRLFCDHQDYFVTTKIDVPMGFQ
jgi:hypothetical protein